MFLTGGSRLDPGVMWVRCEETYVRGGGGPWFGTQKWAVIEANTNAGAKFKNAGIKKRS